MKLMLKINIMEYMKEWEKNILNVKILNKITLNKVQLKINYNQL